MINRDRQLKIKAKNSFIKKEKETSERKQDFRHCCNWLAVPSSPQLLSSTLESFDWGFPFPLNVSPVLNTEAKIIKIS